MPSKEKQAYYAKTANSSVRPDLVFANSLVQQEKIAIDCGCGSGSDIAYLRKQGFVVHAFDIEEKAIALCQERFKEDSSVHLSQESFTSFNYPASSLVVADASLFFCPTNEFDFVWNKIYQSLSPGGVFCGSFLGPNDTMASPDFNRDAYWPHILVFEQADLRAKFRKFEINRFEEHNIAGEASNGEPHQWHIYSVVARKT